MSIKTKIIALVVGLVLLMGTTGLLIGRNLAGNALKDQAKDHLVAIAHSRTDAIENLLNYQLQSVESLAAQVSAYYEFASDGSASTHVQPDQLETISEIMLSMVETNPYVWQALWVDANGTVIASSHQSYTTKITSQIDWNSIDYNTIDWNEIDLSQVDWSHVDFSRVDFSKIDLSRIDWSQVDLSQIDFREVDLTQLDLSQVDFSQLDLSNIGVTRDNISQRDLFIRGKEGPWIGNIALYENSTEFHMVASAPFYSGGQLAGVMVYVGGEDELRRLITNTSGLGKTGETYLIDRNGTILTPSRFVEDAVLSQTVSPPEAPAGTDHTGAVTRENYMGDKVIGVYHHLPEIGWSVVAEQNHSEVLAPIDGFTQTMIGAMLTLLAIWLILALLLSRAISAPITRLRHGAEQIIQGNWDHDVATSASDETGQLSRAFSTMTARVKQSQDKLHDYSRNLEENIQKLEHTKEALTASEMRFRQIIETAPFAYYRIGRDGLYEYVNPEWGRHHGYTNQEILGRSHELTQPAETRDQARAIFNRVLAGETIQGQFPGLAKHGPVEHCVNVKPVYRNGDVVAIEGFLRDITEEKRAEAALRESEERYRGVVENVTDIIWTVDMDMKITYMSPSVTAIRGFTVEEAMSQSVDETMTPESFDRIIQTYYTELANDLYSGIDPLHAKPIEMEMELYCKDGSTIWAQVNMSFLWGPNAEIVGLIGVTRDISQSKQAEAALRESEERFRALAENSTDTIMRFDRQGRHLYVNPVAEKTTGIPVAEFIGRTHEDLSFPKDMCLLWRNAIEQVFQSQNTHRIEFEFDGIWYDWILVPELDAGETTRAVTASARDITERKRAEEAVRHERDRAQMYLDIAGVIILILDTNGTVEIINSKGCQILGHNEQEIVGKNWYDHFLPPSVGPQMARRAEAVLIGNEVPHSYFEGPVMACSGEVRLIGWHNTILRDEQGNAIKVLCSGEDITERKQAEEALQESEERYRRVVENVTDIVFTTDMNLNFTYMSPSVTAIRGFTVEEALAQSLEEVMPPHALEFLMELYTQELEYELSGHDEKPRNVTFELEQYCRDGSTIWTQTHTTFVRGSDGKPSGILGVSRDISERKHAEDAMRQERDRAQRYLDIAGVMILIIDADGQVQLINRKGCEILGYPENEIVGKNWFDHFVPQRIQLELARFNEKVRSTQEDLFSYYENPVLTRSGEERLIAWHNTVLRDDGEKVIGILCSGEDITERKQAEERLKLTQFAIDQASIGCWWFDSEGYVIYVNDQACAPLGYTREEMMGMTAADFDPGFKDGEMPSRKELLKQKTVCFETLHQRKDGSTVPVEVTGNYIELGNTFYNFCFSQDITERKRAEAKIMASLREKEVLLKEIHHRVKNNLQIISSLLSLQSTAIDDASASSIFKESQDRVRSMALIHEKLYQSHDLARVDFGEYTRELCRNLSHSYGAASRGITFNINVDSIHLDVDTAIPCGLIVNELISNSLKYAFPQERHHGNGRQLAPQISIDFAVGPNRRYTLAISDNGIGLPQNLDICQAQSLGLQLVTSLADQLEGSTTVSGTEGTHFQIEFTHSATEAIPM